MCLLLLVACGQAPTSDHPPPTGPVELSAPWATLGLPVEGVDRVVERPDSLLVRGPEESLDVEIWAAALESHGWTKEAASVGRGGLHAVRYVLAEVDGAPAPDRTVVFGATRYEGRATHTLTFVEVQ